MADVPETVVVILGGSATQFFPNPVHLQRGSVVKWHCNPIPGQPQPESFKVEFDDPNPFGIEGLDGTVGSTTVPITVVDDAVAEKYSYHVTIGNRTFDPEIIIDEAVPEPRAKHAQAAR